MDERRETEYAKAWREWQDSPEGQRTLESNSIEIPARLHKYYMNRINLAFAAGWNARGADSASSNESISNRGD